MTESMNAVVVNYRVGPKSQMPKECILQFVHVSSVAEACKLIGRKVAWKENENNIIGKVVALHGKKGLVRARFRKGVPGQALGTKVRLLS